MRYVLKRDMQVVKVVLDIDEAVSWATILEGRMMMWDRESADSSFWVLSNPIPGNPIWSIEEEVETINSPPPREIKPLSFIAKLKQWFHF